MGQNLHVLQLVSQTPKGSQESTTSCVPPYHTVIRLDNRIRANVAKRDYWLSEQADGACMVEKGTRQNKSPTFQCQCQTARVFLQLDPHSINSKCSVFPKQDCIVCVARESC